MLLKRRQQSHVRSRRLQILFFKTPKTNSSISFPSKGLILSKVFTNSTYFLGHSSQRQTLYFQPGTKLYYCHHFSSPMQEYTKVHKRISTDRKWNAEDFATVLPSVDVHTGRQTTQMYRRLYERHTLSHTLTLNMMNHTCLCGKAVWTVGFRQHSCCHSLWRNFETSNESALFGIGMYFRLEVHPNDLFCSPAMHRTIYLTTGNG
jgi:hypothetical protein